MKCLEDIPGWEAFAKIEPIHTGWSGDEKYRVETRGGQRMFLKVSGVERHGRKKSEYEMMERVYSLGGFTSRPYGFGVCGGGAYVYALSEWLEGENAERALPHMSHGEQRALGVKTGEALRKLHTLHMPPDAEPWSVRFKRKVQSWVDAYESEGRPHPEIGEMLVEHLIRHGYLLDSRPQTWVHGDCNTENIMVRPNGDIALIDFNSYNASCGDPWCDLDTMSWTPTMYPYFYTGQIAGYFNDEPPPAFWDVLSYYLAYDALAALTDPLELNGIEDGRDVVRHILEWTDSFRNPMPTWYMGRA